MFSDESYDRCVFWLVVVSFGLVSYTHAFENTRGRGAAHFPNVVLTTHTGEEVRFYDDLVEKRVVAINFIYTSCKDSCPAETAKLRRVYDLLGNRVGRDIFMYSISIDPENDTVEVLSDFVENYKIGSGWTFLRGKEEDVTLLQKRLGLYLDESQLEGENDHNISLIVGNDRTGKWVKRSPFDNPHALADLIGYELFDGVVKRENVVSFEHVPEAPRYSRGESLWRSRCETCHSIGGEDMLGPDLLGVTAERERAWLHRWLREPDKMLEEGDPIARELSARYPGVTMPNLRLDDSDADALIQYMERESARVHANRERSGPRNARRAAHSGHGDHSEAAAGQNGDHGHHGHHVH